MGQWLRSGLLAALTLFAGTVLAQPSSTALVSVGGPVLREVDVLPGQTSAEVVVPVSEALRLQLQIVAPVPNAVVTLFDPSGAGVSLVSATLLDGTAQAPAIPGMAMNTPWLAQPASGAWRVRIAFAPATTRTVIFVTALIESRYRAAVVLGGTDFRQGDASAVSLFVLDNEAPVTGAAISLTAQAPSGQIMDLTPNDSANPGSADGRANDGLYTGALVFEDVGRYILRGRAQFTAANGAIVTREAQTVAFVSAPKLTLTGISTGVLNGPASCIAALTVNLATNLLVPGQVVATATLRASNGTRMRRTLNANAAAGALPLSLQFAAADVRNELGVNGPYALEQVQVVVTAANGTTLEANVTEAGVTAAVTLVSLCDDPVRVGSAATVVPVVTNGYISALDVSFPVTVRTAGAYRISFRFTGGERQQLAASSQSRSFVAGTNIIRLLVPANSLQTADGPFQVESVLVLGPAGAASVSVVSSSAAFSRWQFTPTFRGDLNGDARVDVVDRDLLATFRNQRALQPGDRRDLDRNGIIDLRDVQLLQRGYCAPGFCVP